MQVCGQYFNVEMVGRIQSTVELEPGMSRCELARRVCSWLDWRSPSGKLQEMSCRKALLELHRRGAIRLPECEREYAFQKRRERSADEFAELSVSEVCCSLAELGDVEVVLVPSRYSKLSGVWNGLMERYHYLGSGPLCGAQLRYLVRANSQSSRGGYGWLGGLSFSAATWRLRGRDRWIGWSEAARRAHLQEVVCNSRFLVLPTVQAPHLASHVLGSCLRRLPGDWEARYGYAPALVETFVDAARFRGTSYRAANFIHVGQTAARSDPHPNGKVSQGVKEVYVYPLRRDWQAVLCCEPQRGLGFRRGVESPRDWVEEEFGRVALYDARLKERLYLLARDFYAQPGVLIPQVCEGSEAANSSSSR